MKDKLYIVRTYVKAPTAALALRRARTLPPDDVYVDDDWRKNNGDRLADAVGFSKPEKDAPDDV